MSGSPTGGASDGLVWYAAFGSNLWRPRFQTYLSGGPVAHSPAGRVQAGARDPAPPRADLPVVLTHELFFARSSQSWGGGGVAFIRPPSGPGAGGPAWTGAAGDHAGIEGTLGRLWLITADQFLDVAGQENGRDIDPRALDLRHLAAVGQRDVCDGWYGRVLHLGAGPEGHPIVTFTCPDPHVVARRPAHPAYLRVMGLGLMETWSLEPSAAADYLIRRTAAPATDPPADLTAADLTAADLTADLTRWAPGGTPPADPGPARPAGPGTGSSGSASVAP